MKTTGPLGAAGIKMGVVPIGIIVTPEGAIVAKLDVGAIMALLLTEGANPKARAVVPVVVIG